MKINTIYNEDCLKGMNMIPNECVDLVVTSPPYNIKKKYASYKDDLTLKEYLTFLKEVFSEIYRVMKSEANFLLNVGRYIDQEGNAIPLEYFLFPILTEIGFKFRQKIIWYTKGGMAAKKKLTGQNETIMWLYKERYIFNLDAIRVKEWKQVDKRNNPNGKNPTDVWEFNRVAFGSKEKTNHPCQFPVTMIERITKGFSVENGLVLDPFIGSGTTAIACLNTNRNYLGFELDKDYCQIANERISKHSRNNN